MQEADESSSSLGGRNSEPPTAHSAPPAIASSTISLSTDAAATDGINIACAHPVQEEDSITALEERLANLQQQQQQQQHQNPQPVVVVTGVLLVDGSSDDVPLAQALEENNQSSNNNNNGAVAGFAKSYCASFPWWAYWVTVFVILGVVTGTVVAVVLKRTPSPPSSPSFSPTTNSITTVVPTLEVRRAPTTVYPSSTKAFATGIELQQAVDSYFLDGNMGPNTVLAAQYGYPMGSWDVSQVSSFVSLFNFHRNKTFVDFNEDISSWNTASAINMSSMFKGAEAFNSDLSSWDVSRVQDMSNMFQLSHIFSQNISGWSVDEVRSMRRMFSYAFRFNQDLSAWNVSRVTDMRSFAYGAWTFNQNLCTWRNLLPVDADTSLAFTESGCPFPSTPSADAFCTPCS